MITYKNPRTNKKKVETNTQNDSKVAGCKINTQNLLPVHGKTEC